jgi:hypothetical protein
VVTQDQRISRRDRVKNSAFRDPVCGKTPSSRFAARNAPPSSHLLACRGCCLLTARPCSSNPQDASDERRFRDIAIKEAIETLSGGRASMLNATEHPMFQWYVNKIEFSLNLEAAIESWQGVDAPDTSAPQVSDSSSRRLLQANDTKCRQSKEVKCRKPTRGLKATSQKKCRKIKNRAYFGKLIKRKKNVLKPDECCTLCGKTAGCVSWTVKPKSAGKKERGCFLRKAGKKTTKTLRGYWSGYILTAKSPSSSPTRPPSPADEPYEAPSPAPGNTPYEAPYEAPGATPAPDVGGDPNFDDFWDEIDNNEPAPEEPTSPYLPPGTKKYKELLDLHWRFYEAQRSGPEPSWNRISCTSLSAPRVTTCHCTSRLQAHESRRTAGR